MHVKNNRISIRNFLHVLFLFIWIVVSYIVFSDVSVYVNLHDDMYI